MKYFNSTAISIATVVFAFLVLVKALNVSLPLEHRVISMPQVTELSVTGEGKVDVVPDTAFIEAGITVSRVDTAESAKNQLATVNNAIIASLKQLGIKKEDIKTSNFNIYPDYDYGNMPMPMMESESTTGANPRSRIAGYSGSANVTVKIRNKDLVTQAIENVTQAGATNVSAARFSVENPEKFREEARNKAIKNAKEQAAKLAKSLGIRLGRITNFVESGSENPYYGRELMMASDSKTGMSVPPTIEEGTQSITTSVTLYFERK